MIPAQTAPAIVRTDGWDAVIRGLGRDRPVLIAGPTASGKSALALRIAERLGGVIVNADALQVYENWRVLSARPTAEDEARAPHVMFGHVARDHAYSTGAWLRAAKLHLSHEERPIFVGGTGLYFRSLTEGLAEIPAIPPQVRAEADALLRDAGTGPMIAALDLATQARLDLANPARVQRAWEVQRATGRGLAAWQADTPPPALPLTAAHPLVLDADRDWLAERIARRFGQMLRGGALEEARANLHDWDPARPSSRAIGGPELIAHLRGEITLEEAERLAVIATRQYAKRQRTWFRARMTGWQAVARP
ncbi:tRNA (adenosine(37)-N6)-dimethylallyltransferase MiaA [Pseudooceanicola aestuarii]|uniref:tRNA (adenosine(37)-N6)-dimethylallyltransferase MiaA n=1 Tax=Pseudooceanicola aestuarii TaxID=2697319 RepID=UPI001EF7E761|nr:tRNA (adenosine(37)-N6)-dimethylallyltransferase MiaA [Pseudooceanicola aestuarii]